MNKTGYSSMHRILHLLVLFVLISFTSFTLYGQQALNKSIGNALNELPVYPKLICIKNNGIKIPAGGHLQGIQRLNDSLFIITGSSSSIAYYLIANINSHKISGIHKIADAPFKHAGGCQVIDNKLAVGVEDNAAKNRSHLTIISFNAQGAETQNHIVAYRQGVYKRSTAGAVGITKNKDGNYTLMAGDWDSDYFDLYTSKNYTGSVFDSTATYTPINKTGLPSYQSVNLVADSTGHVYMLGFSLTRGKNQLDVDRLNDAHTITVQQTKTFHCLRGAGFRYAAGMGITKNGCLVLYTCNRNATHRISINIYSSN